MTRLLISARQGARAFVAAAGILCGVMSYSSSALSDAAAQRQAEQEVTKILHEYIASYATTDMPKYFSYYADDMTLCCSEGWWSKQAYETMWTELVKNGGGAAKSEVRDLRLQASPSGDTVIASYLLPVIDRKPAPGQSPNIVYNMSEVWMKNAGKWQIVHLTFSIGKAGEPGPVAAQSRR